MSRWLDWEPAAKFEISANGEPSKPTERSLEGSFEGFEGSHLGDIQKIARSRASRPRAWWEDGADCWHCSGRGECSCLSCETVKQLEYHPGPCAVCHGAGKIPVRVQ